MPRTFCGKSGFEQVPFHIALDRAALRKPKGPGLVKQRAKSWSGRHTGGE